MSKISSITKMMTAAAAMALSGCAGMGKPVPDVHLKVRGDREIWPAMVTAFQMHNTRISEIDLYSGVYRTGDFEFNDFAVRTRARYAASIGSDSMVNVRLTDMYMQNGSGGWVENDALLTVNPKAMTNGIKISADQIYQNDSLYSYHKNRLLTSFDFNYMAMKKMTEVARNAWMDSLTGRYFHWTGNLQDLKENSTNPKINRKYVALFAFSTNQKQWDITSRIYVRLFTSNPEYIKANKGTSLGVSGKLLSASVSEFMGESFFYDFIDTTSKWN